jgi:hypothetical protein
MRFRDGKFGKRILRAVRAGAANGKSTINRLKCPEKRWVIFGVLFYSDRAFISSNTGVPVRSLSEKQSAENVSA